MFFQNIAFGYQAVQFIFVSAAVTEFAKRVDYSFRCMKLKPPGTDGVNHSKQTCPNEQ